MKHEEYFSGELSNGIPAYSVIGQAVYVSIAVISQRIDKVQNVVSSLLLGSVIPTRIYLYVSKYKFLMDKGIKEIPPTLKYLTTTHNVTLVYVDNIGPHRKLLPILREKWHEDCVIITMDDDKEIIHRDHIQELLKHYISSRKSAIIANRVRRFSICSSDFYNMLPYDGWPVVKQFGIREMLVLPTGVGSVLYRPRFFHPIVFDVGLRKMTITGDDILFRLAALIKEVPVVTACSYYNLTSNKVKKQPYIDCPKKALVFNFNSSTDYAKQKGNIKRQRQRRLAEALPNTTLTDLWLFNTGNAGHNDNMLKKTLHHLKKIGLLDMSKFIKKYARLERPAECMKGNNISSTCSLCEIL